MKLYASLLVCVFLFLNEAIAQDVESVIKSEPFKFKGNILAGFTYNTSSETNALSPFSYRVQANPVINIYSFSFPFTFTYLDNRFNLSKPTFRLGFNPKYKWVQLYTGANSFTLSPYTFNGQNVRGYGLRLSPGKFRFLGFYGSVQNFTAQRDTLDFGVQLLPTYKRKVLGAKLGFEGKKTSLSVNAAKIYDVIEDDVVVDNSIPPEENFVVGIKLDSRITKYFKFGIDTGASIITNDIESDTIADLKDRVKRFGNLIGLEFKQSTRLAFAGSAYANAVIAKQTIGVEYKVIQPFYRSLGLFFINDDIQNITVNTSLNIASGAVRLNASYGNQINNLNSLKGVSSTRSISAVQLNVRPIKPLTVLVNYSNFSQDQELRRSIDSTVDQPEFGQVSNTIGITTRYSINTKESSKNYNINYSRFNFRNLSDDNILSDIASENQVVNANYSFNNRKNKWGFRVGANYNTAETLGRKTVRYGGSLGYNKAYKEKLRATFSATFNVNDVGGEQSLLNVNGANISYKVGERQSISIGLFNNNSFSKTNPINSLRGNLNYALNF